MNYTDYIEIVPEKRFGRPCIKGARISVYDVLNWLANGMTKSEIIEDFPELNERKSTPAFYLLLIVSID